jgi:hypothetical protein
MIEKFGYVGFKHKQNILLQYLIFPRPYLEITKRAVTIKLGAYILTRLTNLGKTTPVKQKKAR